MLARIGIPAFQIGFGTKIYGKPDNLADSEFVTTTRNGTTNPSDEFREDWDFTSLEHVARFGFTLGLNIANQESMPRWNPGDEFAVAGR